MARLRHLSLPSPRSKCGWKCEADRRPRTIRYGDAHVSRGGNERVLIIDRVGTEGGRLVLTAGGIDAGEMF